MPSRKNTQKCVNVCNRGQNCVVVKHVKVVCCNRGWVLALGWGPHLKCILCSRILYSCQHLLPLSLTYTHTCTQTQNQVCARPPREVEACGVLGDEQALRPYRQHTKERKHTRTHAHTKAPYLNHTLSSTIRHTHTSFIPELTTQSTGEINDVRKGGKTSVSWIGQFILSRPTNVQTYTHSDRSLTPEPEDLSSHLSAYKCVCFPGRCSRGGVDHRKLCTVMSCAHA